MAKPGIECFRDKRVGPLGTPDRLGDRYLARRGFACSLEQSFTSFHLVGRSHDWIPVPARADRHGSLLVVHATRTRRPKRWLPWTVTRPWSRPPLSARHGRTRQGKCPAAWITRSRPLRACRSPPPPPCVHRVPRHPCSMETGPTPRVISTKHHHSGALIRGGGRNRTAVRGFAGEKWGFIGGCW